MLAGSGFYKEKRKASNFREFILTFLNQKLQITYQIFIVVVK